LDWRGYRLEVLVADARRARLVRITNGATGNSGENQAGG
jgi:hypothetical protein